MRQLILLGVLVMAGCDSLSKSCTTRGCGVPFEVNFVRASGWPAGAYRIEVEADGVGSACEAQLPFPSCQVAVALPCEGPRTWGLGLSGCALPLDSHTISGVSFNETRPATVKVTVFHDRRSIGTGSFTPTYTVSHPNGPECEPECRTAPAASLALE